MKNKQPSFTKGVTGSMLKDCIKCSKLPLHVDLERSVAFVRNSNYTFIAITVRGSSHCRRKQARQLQTWLREQQGGVQ